MYVGNLAPDVTDAELQTAVSQFGTVLDVKIYRKGGYAFAQFASHAEAVRAIVGLSGQNLGGKALKCSWGRHQARKGGGGGGGQLPVDPASFEYLALQQQQQQMSLQQQLAMQQLGYAPAGYAGQVCAPLQCLLLVNLSVILPLEYVWSDHTEWPIAPGALSPSYT